MGLLKLGFLSLSSFALLVSLGCSSSSSSSDGGSPPPDEEPDAAVAEVDRISLTGLAIKGLAQGAAINVYPLESGEFSTTAIGTGASNSQGVYELLLSEDYADYSGAVKIVLSYVDGALIQCDDPNGCGAGINSTDFYPMPSDFQLVAISELSSGVFASNGSSVINLTALTTLAASFIEAETIGDNRIKQGNNQIRAVLSLPSTVDLTATRASNIVNDESVGNDFYGAVNAAFQRIATDESKTLTQVLNEYIQTFQNGQIIYKSSTNLPTFKDIIDATIDLGILTGADLTKAQGIQTVVDGKANDEETNIIPPSISIGNNLEVNTSASITLTSTTLIGTPVSYSWKVISGPEAFAEVVDAASNTLSFTAPTNSTEFSVRVIAKDGAGLTDNDIVTVRVNEALAGNTAISGEYTSMLSQRGFSAGIGTGNWREFFSDSDYPSAITWNLLANADGSANLNIGSGTGLFYNIDASLQTLNSMNVASDITTETEDAETLSLIQLASGNLTINIPSNEYIDDVDQTAELRSGTDLNLLKMAEGSYLGNMMEQELEYPVVGDVVQYSDINEQRQFVTRVMLSKKHATNGFSTLNGKQYVGMEHFIELTSSDMLISVTRLDLTFTNAAGAATLDNENEVALLGLVNKANAEFVAAMSIITPAPEPGEAITFSNINQGHLTFTDSLGIFSLSSSTNLQALIGQYTDWGNISGGNEFNNPAVDFRDSGVSVYLEKPSAPISLDGKTYTIQSVTHYNEVAQAPVGAEEIASRFYVSIGTGSMSINGGIATFTLSEREFVYRYPNDDVTQLAELISSSQIKSNSWQFQTPATTNADGCFNFVDAPTMLACTNGQGLVMREYNGATGSTSLDKFLTFYIGSLAP